MQPAEIILKMAALSGWQVETLDSDIVLIKHKDNDTGEQGQFIVQFLSPLKPDLLVLEIQTPGMPMNDQVVNDKEFVLKIAKFALARNFDLKLMRWGLADTADGANFMHQNYDFS